MYEHNQGLTRWVNKNKNQYCNIRYLFFTHLSFKFN